VTEHPGPAAEIGTDPLSPLREALLSRARADAAATLAAADRSAAETMADAQQQVAAMLAAARETGRADAAVVLAGERARAARTARGIVLAAQRDAYEAMRVRARDAVSGLRGDPLYPALLEALRQRARVDLGPEAVLREHPRGGVIGEGAGRRVEYSLDDLADEIVDRLGAELDGVWAP
jgi:vacuolar-type H+-ATPase subunit E/Vma4